MRGRCVTSSLGTCPYWAAWGCQQQGLTGNELVELRQQDAPRGLLFSASAQGRASPKWSISGTVCTPWSWNPNLSLTYSPLICSIHKLRDLRSRRNARWYAHPGLTQCATTGFLRLFLVVYMFGGEGSIKIVHFFSWAQRLLYYAYLQERCLRELQIPCVYTPFSTFCQHYA